MSVNDQLCLDAANGGTLYPKREGQYYAVVSIETGYVEGFIPHEMVWDDKCDMRWVAPYSWRQFGLKGSPPSRVKAVKWDGDG